MPAGSPSQVVAPLIYGLGALLRKRRGAAKHRPHAWSGRMSQPQSTDDIAIAPASVAALARVLAISAVPISAEANR